MYEVPQSGFINMQSPHKYASRFVRPVVLLSAIGLITGCGGKPATVSGTVTVAGKTIDQGAITFSPVGGGMRASGIIQPDGSYQIRTNRDIGLDVGEYEVAVVSRELIFSSPDAPPTPGRYLAPKQYGNTKTSGLRFSVEKGPNVIDIDLSAEELESDQQTQLRHR